MRSVSVLHAQEAPRASGGGRHWSHQAVAITASLGIVTAIGASLAAQADPAPPQASSRRVRLNRAIEQLEKGGTAVGGQIFNANVGSLSVARDLTNSSLHFATFDMKTGLFDIARLERSLLGLIDRARILSSGTLQPPVNAFARVPIAPHHDPTFVVGQMLDIGMTGFVFPEIENPEDAEAAVRAMRYPYRDGYHSSQAHPSAEAAAWYWGVSETEYRRRADVWPLDPEGELLAILQIETVTGIANLDAILRVPGVGAIMLGPVTLAGSLGETDGGARYNSGELSPRVEAAVQTVLQKCLAHRVACGIPIVGVSAAATLPVQRQRQAQGFRLMYLTGQAALH
jgi:4-hydroxy-2-oxoheptanedioate aldolase